MPRVDNDALASAPTKGKACTLFFGVALTK